VIESFRHKGLRELWQTNRSAKVSANLVKRIRVRLDFLEAAKTLEALNQPGFDFSSAARRAAAVLHSCERSVVHHL
jgi:toxin HigB-1